MDDTITWVEPEPGMWTDGTILEIRDAGSKRLAYAKGKGYTFTAESSSPFPWLAGQVARQVVTPAARVDDHPTPATLHGPTTSHVAAASMRLNVGELRRVILALISRADEGFTDAELEAATGRKHQSVSAARNALAGAGLIGPIYKDGVKVTRPTPSGRPALVWVTTAAGEQALREAGR